MSKMNNVAVDLVFLAFSQFWLAVGLFTHSQLPSLLAFAWMLLAALGTVLSYLLNKE